MSRRHRKQARDQRTQNEAATLAEVRKPFAAGLVIVILMGIFGLGTGWFAGKALSGALRPAVSSDSADATENAAPPQTETKPQQTTQPPVTEPPQQEKTEEAKDKDAAERDDERPSVEKLGRKALKKILKQIEERIDPDKPRPKRKDKKSDDK